MRIGLGQLRKKKSEIKIHKDQLSKKKLDVEIGKKKKEFKITKVN